MSSAFNEPQSDLGLGFHYFIYGWRLMLQRRLMPFVLIPVVINAVLMIALLWFFISHIAGWADWIVSFMPSWLDWLTMILVPLAVLSLIMLFYFTFTTITNFIAAPFNALLAEKVELQLTGEQLNNMTVAEMLKDVPRMLKREWQKMAYSIPRFIALFLLSFVPVVGQTVVPVLTFVFGAWLLAIQYCDYPFDNHKISFKRMRNALGQRKILNFTFGTFVSIFTALPFVNLVVMPVAVCGATAMWVEEYRNFMLDKTSDFDGADYTTKTGREVSTETRSGAVNPNVRNGEVKPH
ncbi:sulfate transporter CysZ [Actinobacillus genomosp. 1]|uniref:sulfate transporter CysZ n=1 Tax=Actinobacillus genomosp. 1 TaxID=254839 RepID=UPI002442E900|nr:sulfate transporter CysZ [Actinobacillus genomosp. 1]WGE90566.1 sulfate transporter CysZ [Actinobacillus genomosp. 1]